MQAFQEAHEFVDYYALLEAPATATDAVLRKRIFELYEEARHNLEHRNHRKRFYYTTLYETHLARARHFLLDTDRRPRYDACLRAYQAGQPFDFAALFESGAKTAAPAAAQPATPPPLAGAAPAVQAARAAAPGATPATAPPPRAAPPPAAPPPVKTAAPAPVAAPETLPPAARSIGPASPNTATPTAVPAGETPVVPSPHLEKLMAEPTLRISAEEDPRRRDFLRREMIGIELRNRGRIVGFSAAAVFVICGTATLYPLQSALLASHKSPDQGLSAADMFVVVSAFLLICAIAMWASWQASRFTRRHIIGTLSRLSYEELLRQCKH